MSNLDPNDIDDLESIKKIRNIHTEIVNFGVNEKEIKKLIELLCLELEDTSLMKNIIDELNNYKKEPEEKIIL